MKRSADLPGHSPPVVGFADCYVGGFVDGFHTHDRGQLSLFLAGTVTVSTRDSSFVLSPGQCLWLPANTLHQASCRTDLMFQVVYVEPDLSKTDLPPKMFDASSLLRGLVDEIVTMKYDFIMDERMSAIAQLLIDEIRRAPRIAERVLLPKDHRLRRVCEAITATPGDSHDIVDWALEGRIVLRTFITQFLLVTGMSFSTLQLWVSVLFVAFRISAGQYVG